MLLSWEVCPQGTLLVTVWVQPFKEGKGNLSIQEADIVRLLQDVQGITGRTIPAGTEGYVVAPVGAVVAADVELDGEPDHFTAPIEQVEFVRKGQPIS
jgi:hypothetical protein